MTLDWLIPCVSPGKLLFLLLGRRRNRGNLAQMTPYIHLALLCRSGSLTNAWYRHCCARLIRWLHNTRLPPDAIAARNRCALHRARLRNSWQIMCQNRKMIDFDVSSYTSVVSQADHLLLRAV